MNQYKVLSAEGIEVDGVHFAQDEILELDTSSNEVAVLLETNSIALDEVKVDEEEVKEESEVLYFQHLKIVTPVVTEDVEGTTYKSFTLEDGSTYKLSQGEFDEKVSAQQ